LSAARSLQRWLLGLFLVGLAFSITLSESVLLLLGLLWLWRLRDASARAALIFPLAGPVLAFAATTLLSALRSANQAASLVDAKDLLLLATLYVLVDALPDVDAAERFLTRLFLLVTIHAGLSVIQVALCPPEPVTLPFLARFFRRCDRAHGFFSIYMTLAGVLTVVLLATLPRLFGRERQRWMLPAWALSAMGLVLTLTRGAWLGFLVGATALSFFLRRFWGLVAMGGVLLLALLLLPPSGPLQGRFRNLEDPTTMRERLYMWQSGFGIVRDHPLTGVGPGQVKAVYPRYARPEAVRKTTSHVHNTPLQIAAERGLLGLGAWLWLWIGFFREGVRCLRRLGPAEARERTLVAGSLAAALGFLVAGLFEYNFGDSEVVLVAYAVMALPFIVGRPLPR
jgi:O-antigen ligase